MNSTRRGEEDEAIQERVARLEEIIEAIKEQHSTFHRWTFFFYGGAGVVISFLAMQTMYLSGQQSVVLSRLDALSERIIAVVNANVSRENRLQSDIAEIRGDIKHHIENAK